MSWTYDIDDGDSLNKRWYALCELATQLRERIIDTDGDDTNAPTYTKYNATTSKQITITDFEGAPIRSSLLRSNVDVFRAAIMEINTEFGSHWCNSSGTTRYTSITELLTIGSYGSSWIDHSLDYTPNYWKQMYEAMENLRYIFWNFKRDSGAYGSASAVKGVGDSGSQASEAAAWSAFLSDYSTSSVDMSASTGGVFLSMNSSVSPGTYRLRIGDGLGVFENTCSALTAFYNGLVGTILDSGWCMRWNATLRDTGTEHTTFDFDVDYNYETLNVTGNSSTDTTPSGTSYANLAGSQISFGTITLSPSPPTSTDVGLIFSPLSLPGLVFLATPDVSETGFSGQTITKNDFNYYLTDLGHPGLL